jgi:hypothetical protein
MSAVEELMSDFQLTVFWKLLVIDTPVKFLGSYPVAVVELIPIPSRPELQVESKSSTCFWKLIFSATASYGHVHHKT